MGNELKTVEYIPQSTRVGEPSASIIEVSQKLPPRDLVRVEENIRSVVKANPEIAEVCIYCKPVGKKDGLQQFAIGPSIRLTEIGQQCFGRLWVNGSDECDDKRVKATVVCFDLATLNITFGTHSKSITGKYGKYSDAMVETTTSAALSIARRNALTQQMRPQLESVMGDIKKTVIEKWCGGAGVIDDANKSKKLLEAWGKIGKDFSKRWSTTDSELQNLVKNQDSYEDKLVYLIGIRNFLMDNPDSYKDVFGREASRGLKDIEEQEEQTPRQKYETLKLQLTTAGKEKFVTDLVNGHSGMSKHSEKDFDDSDLKYCIGEMEKEMAKK